MIHKAQFMVVALLAASLASSSPLPSCCLPQQHESPGPDRCAHHMPHRQPDRRSEETTRSDHRCCSYATKPSPPIVVTSGYAWSILSADRNAIAQGSIRLPGSPQLPEEPPPLETAAKRAVICTYLI